MRRAHGLMFAGGGGRAARALQLLLLLVLALAAVEYLFGSILDAFPLRTYLYTPRYNATQPTNIPPLNMTRQDNEVSTALLITKIMDGIKNLVTTEEIDIRKNETELPLCDIPSDLGPISVNKTAMELDVVNIKYPEVHWGGRYSPPNCTARHKVAIIVPYRDRQQHLAIFLNHMHPFLMKQQLEYGMFIVEQEGNQDFNRAKLMNVGFVESQKLKAGGWQCFVFHDIDLLPLDQRNVYSCPRQPRHMSSSVDKQSYDFELSFGGVSAVTLEQFEKVNGFSNSYWGWGGEDDNMGYRLKKMKYHIARYKMSIARYTMLDHKIAPPNPIRYQLLSQTIQTFKNDGLSTLEYMLVGVTYHRLYTHILVNIDEHRSWISRMERSLTGICSALYSYITVSLLVVYIIWTIKVNLK